MQLLSIWTFPQIPLLPFLKSDKKGKKMIWINQYPEKKKKKVCEDAV